MAIDDRSVLPWVSWVPGNHRLFGSAGDVMFPNSRPSPGHLGSHGGVEMQEITWGECDGEQKDRGFLGKTPKRCWKWGDFIPWGTPSGLSFFVLGRPDRWVAHGIAASFARQIQLRNKSRREILWRTWGVGNSVHWNPCFVIIPRWTFSQALRSSRVSAWPWQIEMTSWWHTKGWCSLAQFFFGIQVCPHFSGTPLLCNSLIAIAWDSCFSPRMFAWLWHVVAKTAGFPGWKFTSSKTPTRSELSESISALSGGIVSPWNGWRMEDNWDNWHYYTLLANWFR